MWYSDTLKYLLLYISEMTQLSQYGWFKLKLETSLSVLIEWNTPFETICLKYSQISNREEPETF